ARDGGRLRTTSEMADATAWTSAAGPRPASTRSDRENGVETLNSSSASPRWTRMGNSSPSTTSGASTQTTAERPKTAVPLTGMIHSRAGQPAKVTAPRYSTNFLFLLRVLRICLSTERLKDGRPSEDGAAGETVMNEAEE